jgi:hypothetical protein
LRVSESAKPEFEQADACDRRLQQTASAWVHLVRHGCFSFERDSIIIRLGAVARR